MIDYRKFRFSKLNTPEFSHLKLLLYWIVYGLFFFIVERVSVNRDWNYMYCSLDDMIPFCEWFVIPYMFWFVYLIGMLLYTLLWDVPSFKRMMWFIICTYSMTIIIYLIYPTAQGLRPETFTRDNIFTRFLAWFYTFDTNTNVNPSIHVIGSMAVLFTAWNTKRFQTRAWRAGFAITAFLICISTVLIKQHSIIDIISALLLCLVFYPIVFKSRAAEKEHAVKAKQPQSKNSKKKIPENIR